MRTWDRLSAMFVKGVKEPGRYADGDGLVLEVAAIKSDPGNLNKSWLFRYQIDKRERWMGQGSARVVSLGEARTKANEARRLLAAGIDPIAHREAAREEQFRLPIRVSLNQPYRTDLQCCFKPAWPYCAIQAFERIF